MRALFALVGIAAIAAAVLMALGMLTVTANPGEWPTVKFEGGKMPEIKADLGSIGLGTENATVPVPTIAMDNATIPVPTLKVEKAGNEAAPAPAEKK